MQPSDKIKGYIETARQQIRWKRAQPVILTEIQNHILDQKDAYVRDGLDQESATDRAILDMGDPVVVGQQLDRVHKPKPDWLLLGLTGVLFLAGLFIQWFLGTDQQWLWTALGILVLMVTYFTDFTILGKYPRIIFFSLCGIIFFMLVSIIRLYNVLEQPIYNPFFNGISKGMCYVLLLFPVAFAGFVYSKRNHGYAGLLLCVGVALICALFSLMVSMPVVTILLSLSCLTVLAGAVIKGWFQVKKWPVLLILFGIAAVLISLPFWGTSGSLHEQKYLRNTVRTFLSQSQVWGSGSPVNAVADSQLKNSTNYLLTTLIHSHGWTVLIGVLAIFTVFFAHAFIKCIKQKNVLGFLVSLAVVSILAIQCAGYIALNTGVLFLDPLPLPLVSYGKSALLVDALLIGLLLSVFRTGSIVRDKAAVPVVRRKRLIQADRGKIIFDFDVLSSVKPFPNPFPARPFVVVKYLSNRKKKS